MRRSIEPFVLVTILVCSVSGLAGPGAVDPAATEMLNLGLRGVYFVPNQGQWADAAVQFGLRSRGLDVAFRESSFTMHLRREKGQEAENFVETAPDSVEEVSTVYESLTLGLTFPGSNAVLPEGADAQAVRFNYHVGGEGRGTACDVPSFGSVMYADLYEGIDLHVTGHDEGIFKYEFHVAPGGDPSQIRINYEGIESLCIDATGDLHVRTAFGTLADAAPVVWQNAGSDRDLVAARFELMDDRTYRIALDGRVDPTRELIIDPDVEWMTYLGGSEYERGKGIVTDRAGAALVTGYTASSDFEGRENERLGEIDAFVLKVDSSGQLQWMTYLGGSRDDWGYAIALDGDENVLVTGSTGSSDFEGATNAPFVLFDAFLLQLNSSGQLQRMTYVGGDNTDSGLGITVDRTGAALVTGYTDSSDFEGHTNLNHGARDAFLLKVDSSGQIQWMTYIGGSNEDSSAGVALDGDGNALMTGGTRSHDFEGRNNQLHLNYDTFLVKVDSSGQLQWMTYLGGSDDEGGYGVAVDGEGNALVAGSTESVDFEGRINEHYAQSDVFLLKVNPSGQLQWMTYLGGRDSDEWGYGVAIDSAGDALVTGSTKSDNFVGRINSFYGGGLNAFVLKVDPDGLLDWMIYLGGRIYDTGSGIALDGDGNALVAGTTISRDFEGRNNSFHGGSEDAFVVKVFTGERSGPQLIVNASCPFGGPIRVFWRRATPGGTIALLFARTTGSARIPNGNPCAGTTLRLGVTQLHLVYQGSAGPDGTRTVNSTASPRACGGYLQLLDLTTCETSNAARLE